MSAEYVRCHLSLTSLPHVLLAHLFPHPHGSVYPYALHLRHVTGVEWPAHFLFTVPPHFLLCIEQTFGHEVHRLIRGDGIRLHGRYLGIPRQEGRASLLPLLPPACVFQLTKRRQQTSPVGLDAGSGLVALFLRKLRPRCVLPAETKFHGMPIARG